MDWDSKTVETYNKSAIKLAEYFRGIGPRIRDIERGLKLAKASSDAKVVEIGCGDGRDAKEIIPRVSWYEGVDPSDGLLSIARSKIVDANFVNSYATSYKYPDNIDVVFAFASLLHVNKHDFNIVLEKVNKALKPGGVFYISLKEREKYQDEIKDDEYGKRMFYYYSIDDISKISSDLFDIVYEDHQVMGNTKWLTVALVKK